MEWILVYFMVPVVIGLVIGAVIGLIFTESLSIVLKEESRNKVHFYVARDKDGSLFLHMGKPIRGETEFYSELYYDHVEFYCCDYSFKVFGLNKNDYTNLKWEDEPIEVFLNMKD